VLLTSFPKFVQRILENFILVSIVRAWGVDGMRHVLESVPMRLAALHQQPRWYRGLLRLAGVGFGCSNDLDGHSVCR
jgi:hypothetical protein